MANLIEHGIGPRPNGEGFGGFVDGDEHGTASKERGRMEGKKASMRSAR